MKKKTRTKKRAKRALAVVREPEEVRRASSVNIGAALLVRWGGEFEDLIRVFERLFALRLLEDEQAYDEGFRVFTGNTLGLSFGVIEMPMMEDDAGESHEGLRGVCHVFVRTEGYLPEDKVDVDVSKHFAEVLLQQGFEAHIVSNILMKKRGFWAKLFQ